MDRSAAASYGYAKASGMLSNSFVGRRTERLFEASTLIELWGLLFKTSAPAIPEVLLAQSLEAEAEKQFVADYRKLIAAYAKPDAVLINLLHSIDYENLKDMAAALCLGETVCPPIIRIDPYAMLQYSAWPDIARITAGSAVSWYNTVPDVRKQESLDVALDKQYTHELWSSVLSLGGENRDVVYELIRQQIAVNNILWAIRLKVYFSLKKEDIILRLAFADEAVQDTRDPLAGDAIRILNYPVDSYDAWKNWKYADLLNPYEEGVVWVLDPRWITMEFKRRMQQWAFRRFHQHPLTSAALVAWFFIKQFELDCIRTAVEGMRLNVDKDIVRTFAGK